MNSFQEDLERRKAALLAADEAKPPPPAPVIEHGPPPPLAHYCPECEKPCHITIADEASGMADSMGIIPVKKVARCVTCNAKVRTVKPSTDGPITRAAHLPDEWQAKQPVKLTLSNPNMDPGMARRIAETLMQMTTPAEPALVVGGAPSLPPKPATPRSLMRDAKKRLTEVKRAIAANQRDLAKLQREMVELETMTGTHPTAKPINVAHIRGAK